MSAHRRTDAGKRRHRLSRRPRLRLALAGGAAIAVLGGGTAFACLGAPGQPPTPAAARQSAQRATGQEPAPDITWTPGPTPATARTPAPRIPATHRTRHPRPPAPKGTANADDPLQQVLAVINKARAAHGLPGYTLLNGLTRAAAAHNHVMADGCGLSHQCPNEPPFYERDQAQGVPASAGGENIGEGGPLSDTRRAVASMAVQLTQGMLDEKPPNDGHRRNILSSTYAHIGIATYRDPAGTVWLTQDFSQ
ncbi:CAP domain-containing protein [Streptomyces silvisoli]|uniref:CAP domain-containing protein n=1 Tax=Streptomyces silvisoli TaxID=3034235 RepID=A0ABT5ZNL8_9ACTN|nr:CAP domain-containing protein [Streptomyces silvisoli]MDF3291422.1 CAP domain-containing protein [Streptomyces silvisoli]